MSAPSAANEQPWEFIVIRGRTMLDAIPTFSPFASMVKRAPLGILVCPDTRNVIVPGFWVQDCSAATQNLLLAARELGLGAAWTGVYPMEGHVAGFAKHCQLPQGVIPLAFVVVGHPAKSRQHNTGLARTGSIQTCGDVTGSHRPDSGLARIVNRAFARYVRESELS